MWRFKLIILLVPILLLMAQEKSSIFFQHKLHVEDAELACEDCHTGVTDADAKTWDIFPKMAVCSDCHDDTADDGDCSLCHSSPDLQQSYNKFWESSGLGFSHKKHLVESADCSKCHSYINDDEEIGYPNTWKMSDCQTCHSKMEKGPSSHDLAWKELHGSEMNSSTSGDCALCHTNNSCEQCHQVQQFTPKVHPNDYILAHSFEAKMGITECTTCHEIVEDCYSCHVSNQIMPMNHNFHNWVNLDDGGIHIGFVETEGELCATCHLQSKDSSCVQCHIGN